MKTISGHIVDVVSRQIFDGVIQIEENRINAIIAQKNVEDRYIIPGFIDAHIHIESSMVKSEILKILSSSLANLFNRIKSPSIIICPRPAMPEK